MRGADTFTESPFMLHRLEDFVPSDHPLRAIRQMVNEALGKMDGLFAGMYEAVAKGERPSIAPEKLLRAMLLQVFYSIRSERQLMEQVQYNLLYRWFIGLAMDDAVWVPTVFTKNRERLLAHDAVIELFNHVVQSADEHGWLSGEHFSVDGTLIQAWASHKSFVRKDGSDEPGSGGSFKGKTRSNETHESSTDADARLYRKGKTASELRFMVHTLSDNRHGLIASALVTQADGYAEREAAKAIELVMPGKPCLMRKPPSRWARTRVMTRKNSLRRAWRWASRRMWHRTPRAGVRRCLTPLRRHRATLFRSKSESLSSRALAGPKR